MVKFQHWSWLLLLLIKTHAEVIMHFFNFFQSFKHLVSTVNDAARILLMVCLHLANVRVGTFLTD